MIPAPPTPREEERLRTLADAELLDTLPEALYDDVTRLAAFICRTPIALVTLVDRDRQWFKARVGLERTQTPRDHAFCAHAIHGSGVLEIPDAQQDPRFVDNPLVTGEPNVRFYAGMPLVVEGGHALGTLCVLDRVPRELDEEQRAALAALGRQVVAHVEQRLMRRDVERRKRELRELSTMQRAILDSANFSIVSTDVDGRIRTFNAGAERLLGFRAAEVVGHSCLGAHLPEELENRAKTLSEELGREVLPGIDSLVAKARLGPADENEWTYVRRDGSFVPVHLSVTALRDAAGATTGYLGIAHDISMRKEVDRLKSEFVSTVSHELRTPLTSIRGAMGLLEGGVAGELPAEARELVQIARQNAERLVRLINDILDLEKFEAGRLELQVATTSATGLVRTALDALGPLAKGAQVRLALEGGEETVVADADRVVQVLVNLVSNAIKYSPAGEVVTVRIERRGGRIRFGVEDHGPGIPEEQHGRLFGRFQQLDGSDTRAKGGTGLGLAISKAIVERHGGTIGIQSAPGAGSTFWFELDAGSAANEGLSGSPPMILLIEDDASAARVAAVQLEGLGAEVVTARDGAAALVVVRARRPDLIVLDVGIPRPDGFELVDILRREAGAIPLLVHTGRGLTAEQRDRLTLGPTRHLTKTRAGEGTFLEAARELLRRPPA